MSSQSKKKFEGKLFYTEDDVLKAIENNTVCKISDYD
jgi:hypothetical protein